MNEVKYTYYIYQDFTTWVQIYPLNNELKLVKRLHETWECIIVTELVGSFVLMGDWFDYLVDNYPDAQLFRIYENGTIDTGTLVFSGSIHNFNNFDYNSKVVHCEDFTTLDNYTTLVALIEGEVESTIALGTEYDINYEFDGTITTKAQKFENIINPFLSTFNFTASDAWYSTENIDLEKIRLADLKDISWLDAPSPNNAERKKITLKKLLEIVQIMFRGYAYLDGTDLKFKTPADFCTNVLNAEPNLIYKQVKKYDITRKFGKELIKFNKNNEPYPLGSNGEWEEADAVVSYSNGSDKVLSYPLPEICTRFTPTVGEYNFDGWFMAICNNSTDDVEKYYYLNTLSEIENGQLCTGNIIYHFYNDYIYTDRDNFSVSGIAAAANPTHYRPFIQMPDYTTVLPSIAGFYDGIRFKYENSEQVLARVWSQSTELKSNKTTFVSFEFVNETI